MQSMMSIQEIIPSEQCYSKVTFHNKHNSKHV